MSNNEHEGYLLQYNFSNAIQINLSRYTYRVDSFSSYSIRQYRDVHLYHPMHQNTVQ